MRPEVSYWLPWQGQNHPPQSPRGSVGLLPSGMQPRWVQMPIRMIQGLWPALIRESSVAGSIRSASFTSSADLISSGVRWRTKIGLPCHITVMPMPSVIGVRSTSTADTASTSRDGFMLSTSAQPMAAAPIPAPAPAMSCRKSRLVTPSAGAWWPAVAPAVTTVGSAIFPQVSLSGPRHGRKPRRGAVRTLQHPGAGHAQARRGPRDPYRSTPRADTRCGFSRPQHTAITGYPVPRDGTSPEEGIKQPPMTEPATPPHADLQDAARAWFEALRDRLCAAFQ